MGGVPKSVGRRVTGIYRPGQTADLSTISRRKIVEYCSQAHEW